MCFVYFSENMNDWSYIFLDLLLSLPIHIGIIKILLTVEQNIYRRDRGRLGIVQSSRAIGDTEVNLDETLFTLFHDRYWAIIIWPFPLLLAYYDFLQYVSRRIFFIKPLFFYLATTTSNKTESGQHNKPSLQSITAIEYWHWHLLDVFVIWNSTL